MIEKHFWSLCTSYYFLGNNISLYFLVGEYTEKYPFDNKILQESYEFQDIIIEKFLDTYDNLTLKTAYALKLYSQHCARTSQYLAKIDDDVFLNTKIFVNLLKLLKKQKHFLQGNINNGVVIRDILDKW